MELNNDNIMCDIWYTEQLGYTEEQHLSLEIESGSEEMTLRLKDEK